MSYVRICVTFRFLWKWSGYCGIFFIEKWKVCHKTLFKVHFYTNRWSWDILPIPTDEGNVDSPVRRQYCYPRRIFYREFESEVFIFSKKRIEACPRLTMIGICLLASTKFKYLGVAFDHRGLTWIAHTKYVVRRCKTRINFMKSIGGTSWGSNPDKLLILFKELVRLV
jgi:hypothetical protein